MTEIISSGLTFWREIRGHLNGIYLEGGERGKMGGRKGTLDWFNLSNRTKPNISKRNLTLWAKVNSGKLIQSVNLYRDI